MILAAISYNIRTNIMRVQGNLAAQGYRDNMLQPRMLNVIDRQREIFQQVYAYPHTARVNMDFFTQNNFNVLPWPSKSPDLNPIEHLWAELDRCIRQRQPPSQFNQLGQALQHEWQRILQVRIQHLIRSMPIHARRCRTVL